MPSFEAAAIVEQAAAHIQAGRFSDAARDCERVLAREPGHPDALWLLGAAHLNMGRYGDARRAAERAQAARPADPRPRHQLATILLREGRLEEFDRAMESAERQCGAHPSLAALRAERLQTAGDHRGALAACRALLDAGSDHPALLTAASRALVQTGRFDEGADLARRGLEGRGINPMSRAALLCALAEALDAGGHHEAAFGAMAEANALKRPPGDPGAQSAAIDRYIAAWGREALAAMPRGAPTELPVFIVGFWRSGTTLVEQTLSCHPGVFGAGELWLVRDFANQHHDPGLPRAEPLVMNPRGIGRPAIARFARAYLSHIRSLAPGAERITDKLPVNFVHLGLISALFPGARIIHCVRNPIDTCVSCYFNLQGNTPYARDLRALGSFYRDYLRLMAHWKSVLDAPILDIAYEDFVGRQEHTARRLVEFVGLPWDEACLRPQDNRRIALTRSIDQVRKPVYASSVARWKRYERHLGPLLEALGPDAG